VPKLFRRFGIGADGVLFLQTSEKADIRMRLFQPDESEAEMCGNGIRCLAKYAHDVGYVKESCSVETGAGIIPVTMGYADDEFAATITMPTPAFERSAIPATGIGEYREKIQGFTVYAANIGVPTPSSSLTTSTPSISPPSPHHQTPPLLPGGCQRQLRRRSR